MKNAELQALYQNGDFVAIDLELGKLLARMYGDAIPEVPLLGALISRAVRNGDSCLAVADLRKIFPSGEWPETLRMLEQHRMLAVEPKLECSLPLVQYGGQLYFQRYWNYERVLEREILLRMKDLRLPEWKNGRPASLLKYFTEAAGMPDIDYQQLAVFMAQAFPFFILSGGPGTGKTTVVAAILAQALENQPSLSIALTAPTGKAQNRLRQSLLESVPQLAVEPMIAEKLMALPCATLHALLSSVPRDEQLPYDLLVVDECSMVSLALAARMFPRLRSSCRVVLLGDKDQLASVEAGAIFADLCEHAAVNRFPQNLADVFEKHCGWQVPVRRKNDPLLTGHLVELRKSHRFAGAPAIGRIAAAIRDGEPDVLELFRQKTEDFEFREVGNSALAKELSRLISEPLEDGYCYADLPKLAKQGTSEALALVFRLITRFQLLTAVHGGPRGVETLNRLMRDLLGFRKPYEPGVLLMIRKNDHSVRALNSDADSGLFNGDIGVVWPDPQTEGALLVYFPQPERAFRLSALPEHEDVFAMTVHKSQGSGFRKVLLVLPEKESALLGRELLYTAITRAEARVEIWGTEQVLAAALTHRTLRHSGLFSQTASNVGAEIE